MTRRLLALALTAGVAAAAPVPKGPPPANPKTSASLQLATAKMSGESIQITSTVTQVFQTAVTETITQNGQQVTITKIVPQTREQAIVSLVSAKGMKASTADGTEISEDELAKKLADPKAVVQVPPGMDAEWKKLFADDVIFLEAAPFKGGIRPGGPAILPFPGGGPVLVPLPAPVPRVIEKDVQVEILPVVVPAEKK